MKVRIGVQRLGHARGLELPAYATPGSAGADLAAALEEPLVLRPMERAAVPTGLVLEIPEGFEGQVRPRSGLALKEGVTLANAPGTIDSDYRGEVKVLLVNLGTDPVTIRRGQRIAQLVITPVVRARFEEIGDPGATHRGDGGFGSTGR
ncbi:MAG: dUTP diphosphatase [Acidobacteria bacterium]|nr:dUTP diphosphatase [Acidobacteriota bacterium]